MLSPQVTPEDLFWSTADWNQVFSSPRMERQFPLDGPMFVPLPGDEIRSDRTVATVPYSLEQDPSTPSTQVRNEYQYLANPRHTQLSAEIVYPPASHVSSPDFWPQDQTLVQNAADNLNFRIETKRVFVCAYGTCNKRYARMPDLRRHHRGTHQGNDQFKCRASGCTRAIRGFPRRDKRDSHEKSMHGRGD
jgi:hypothetical protein